jgi:Peroxidase
MPILIRRATEQQEETNDHLRTLLDSSSSPQQQGAIPLVKADIKALIDANPALAPKFVRLTFHDCVGGCNGCVDMTNVSLPSVLILVYQNTACCVLRVAVLVVLRTFLLLFFLLFGAAYTHTIT